MTRSANVGGRANGILVALVTLLAILCASGIDALQCIDPPAFVTSDVAIHAFGLNGSAFVPLQAARVRVLHPTDDRKDPIAEGTTDDHGFLRLSRLAPGRYLLMIDHDGLHPYLGSLHVTGAMGKSRVLGAELDESCPLSCVVDAGADADARLRACFQRKMEGSTKPSNKELKLTKHGELWSFAA
jgi:hypothetical protein